MKIGRTRCGQKTKEEDEDVRFRWWEVLDQKPSPHLESIRERMGKKHVR